MGADETGPLAAAPAGPDALEEAGAEEEAVAPGEDSYAAQLETVRRLRASGASAEAVRAAAARLKELKRGAYEKLPRGTVGRRKKRRAALDAGVDVLDLEKAMKARDAPAAATYPPMDVPPTDEEGFVVAFDAPTTDATSATRADLDFFARYGFVVYRDVLTAAECAATRDEIFAELERLYGAAETMPVEDDAAVKGTAEAKGTADERARSTSDRDDRDDRSPTGPFRQSGTRPKPKPLGFKRDDFRTYASLPIETYGLAPDPAVFTPRCVANRQKHTVAACLARVLDIHDPRENLLVSHDRWCVFRPTRGVPGGVGDRPDWKTRANLHLDLNPWTYGSAEAAETEARAASRANSGDDGAANAPKEGVAETLSFATLRDFSRETNCVEARTGPHCQGVLVLAENKAEDGGLRVVPGFHSVFDTWVREGLRGGPRAYADAHDDWRFSRLVARAGGAGSFKFGDDDLEIQRRAIRVAAREGSYVLWDQRVAHGTAPNDSSRARIAQFVKGFRKSGVSAGRARRRSERVRLEIQRAGAETRAVVSDLGRKLFGLE